MVENNELGAISCQNNSFIPQNYISRSKSLSSISALTKIINKANFILNSWFEIKKVVFFGSVRSSRNANVCPFVCLSDEKCSRAHNFYLLASDPSWWLKPERDLRLTWDCPETDECDLRLTWDWPWPERERWILWALEHFSSDRRAKEQRFAFLELLTEPKKWLWLFQCDLTAKWSVVTETCLK